MASDHWVVPRGNPPTATPLRRASAATRLRCSHTMLALLITPVGRFRLMALAEAWSWAGLLVGMLFKYVVVENPIGVQIMGPVHGLLFVLYVVFTIEAMVHLRKPLWVLVLGLLAAVPPFTTWWFERWVLRSKA